MFHSRTSKLILMTVIIVTLLISACESPASPELPATQTPEPVVNTFIVPVYATNYSVLKKVDKEFEEHHYYLRDSTRDDLAVQTGVIGYLIDKESLNYVFNGKMSIENWGQYCVFGYEDEAYDRKEYDVTGKTVTVHVRASTLDHKFLQWCQSNTRKTTQVHVVTSMPDTDGFLISYSDQDWQIRPIFRLDKTIGN